MVLLSGMSIAVAVGAAAYAVDLGAYNTARRQAQSVADLAAIAGAADLARAETAAVRSMGENARMTPDGMRVATGIYRADGALAPAARFTPVATGANAVRVEMDTHARLTFGRLLTGDSSWPIRVRATAAVSRMAVFAVGSRLASLDEGVLNGLLTALTGSSVSLSLMDYQALASARVSLFGTIQNLGTDLNIVGGTYTSVLDARVSSGRLARALAAGVDDARARTTLRAIAQVGDAARLETNLSRILDLGPYAQTPLGERPAVEVGVSALDMLMAQLELANGGRMLDTGLGVNLAPLASVQLKLLIGERPVSSKWLAIGAEETRVHTAQTRLLLETRILGGGGLLNLLSVRLPVYVEAAPADAVLRRVVCGRQKSDQRVTVDVRPGVIDAWIGEVSAAALANTTRPVDPPAAELVRVLGIAVTGRAHVAIRETSYRSTEFRAEDVERGTPKTVRTTTLASSLVSSLLGDLEIGLSPLSLDLGLKGAVQALLMSATPALDQLLDSVLQTLGVGLGEADVWVLATRCDGAVLVQ